MDRSARLFLCTRCRVQVVLCRRCDRGNRYCGRSCRRQARDAARREAASRYQRSRRGRLAHAARSRRWRQRRAAAGGDDAQNVTHQGSQSGATAAPLAAWTNNTTASSPLDIATTAEPQDAAATTAWHCRRCAVAQPAWVRQGFVRHGPRAMPASMLPAGRRHDHSP
jgi:hypothetical protein